MVFKMAANSIKMLISEGNLIHNIKHLENKYEKKILPVLKANAYGHDIGMVSEILYNNGYREFAVARLNEAEKILENKKITESRILVFESIGIEFLDIIKNNRSIEVSANTFAELKELIENGISPDNIQLKIDFGFGRNGIVQEDIENLKKYIEEKKLFFKGIYSHLYAVEYEEGVELIEKFTEIVKYLGKDRFQMIHMQNSVGILLFGNCEIMTHLRPGIYIYGLQEEGFFHEGLKQIFRLEGKIAGVRDVSKSRYLAYNLKTTLCEKNFTYAAKIKIGYGEGFFKANEKSYCLINGKPYKILLVTMDNTFIEADELIKEGDNVILYPDVSKIRKDTGLHICEILPAINSRIAREKI